MADDPKARNIEAIQGSQREIALIGQDCAFGIEFKTSLVGGPREGVSCHGKGAHVSKSRALRCQAIPTLTTSRRLVIAIVIAVAVLDEVCIWKDFLRFRQIVVLLMFASEA